MYKNFYSKFSINQLKLTILVNSKVHICMKQDLWLLSVMIVIGKIDEHS